MRFKKLILGLSIVIVTLMLLSIFGFTDEFSGMGCTAIIVGKNASENKLSVMNSTSADGWYNSNIKVISEPAYFEIGKKVPIYWNITGTYRPEKTLEDFSEEQYIKIGEIKIDSDHVAEIPNIVGNNYSYFRTGYSCMNEHQLMIGESTICQKEELRVFPPGNPEDPEDWEDYNGPMMTIEQLQIFALQCTDNVQDAIELIGYLAERHGFLPSCYGMGECLTIADKEEAWVFEIFSVGVAWEPASGKPGAIWAAQRVPDDELVCVPNISRIREIDLKKKSNNFMASENYMQEAIDRGWYSGEPFIWQEAYTPLLGYWSLESEWVRNRLYVVYSTLAPTAKPWNPADNTQDYPFSIEPDSTSFPNGISVKDIIALQRSTMTGTVFDMEADPNWEGSPFATPFPDMDWRDLLKINFHRPIAMHNCSYAFVSQSREKTLVNGRLKKVPNSIGGVLWFCLDNPHMSVHVPIYAGVTEILPSWKTFDRDKFSQDSARWAFALADDLVNRKYQDAIQDLKAVRDPLQNKFLNEQSIIDGNALAKTNPVQVKEYLTNYTKSCMEEAEEAYWDLNWDLIQKYNNNKY